METFKAAWNAGVLISTATTGGIFSYAITKYIDTKDIYYLAFFLVALTILFIVYFLSFKFVKRKID
jgi:hypothetical protein